MFENVHKLVPTEKFNEPYDPNESIINFYKHIDECLDLGEYADVISFTAVQVLQKSLYDLQTTGLYWDEVKYQKKKPVADETWEFLKELFSDLYHHLHEEQTMNTKQGGFSPNNNVAIRITDVGSVLEELAMAESADSTTFLQLVKKNALLTRQLKESHVQNSTLL